MSSTRLRTIAPDVAPDPQLCEEVASALAAGGLVALPTETVYGLAARADNPAALARLRTIKSRAVDQPFSLHVGSDSILAAFPHLTGIVARIAERYWPGPLTLVLEGSPAWQDAGEASSTGSAAAPQPAASEETWTGLRYPAHVATAAILDALDFPVAMTSANFHGEEPLCDAQAIEKRFGADLDLIVDSGAAQLGESSSVLRVGRGQFELLREGLIELEELRRAAGLRIAFVCTGNTCRSPMAEGLARDILSRALGVEPGDEEFFGFHLKSAGVWAGAGSPPSKHAVDVLADQDIDIEAQRSAPVIPEEFAELDRIYCLTAAHRDALVGALSPRLADRIELLHPEGTDVPDPFGGSRAEYEHCAQSIRTAIETRVNDWI